MSDSLSSVNVGPAAKKPTHDLKLTDISGNELGLILCNKQAKIDPRNLVISAMPRTPLRTSEGATGYDDMEPPYVTEVQQTWVGGRGQDDFGKDRTKFYDSYRMDTTREFPVCGPMETDHAGVGVEVLNLDIQSPIDGSFAVTTISDYVNFRVEIENAGTINSVAIRLGNNDVATTFDYAIVLTNSGVLPGAPAGLDMTEYSMEADENEEAYAIFSCNVAAEVGQFLNIVIGNFSADMTVYYSVTCDDIFEDEQTDDLLLTTEDGLMLIAEDEDDRADEIQFYNTVTPAWETELSLASIYGSVIYGTNSYMRMFEYKHQIYAIVNDTDQVTAPSLYMNGYRGVVTRHNAGNKFKMYTNLTLTANELQGKIVYIYNGPGENELQPWRTIAGNTTTGTLTFDDMWNITQTTNTEFVILGTDTWKEITGHGLTKPVTDVAICKDYAVFAQGPNVGVRFMREYNNSGSWSRQFAGHAENQGPTGTGTLIADLLEVGVLPDGETVLWRARVDNSYVDYSLIGDWDATGSPLTGTMLFFDVNYRDRQDLILQRDRLYVDLYENTLELQNSNYLYLERIVADLKLEVKRIIGDAGTIADPDDSYTEAGRTWTALLEEAEDKYALADAAITDLQRQFDDLTVEHKRLLVDWGLADNDDEKIQVIRNDHNIYIEKTRIAGSTGTYDADDATPFSGSITTPTDVTYAGGIAHNVLLGSSTPQAGSDLDEAQDAYDLAKEDIRSLADRAYEIIGDGTIAAPGDILTGDGAETISSELKRAEADLATELAKMNRAVSDSNAIKRAILDLTYQITETTTESEDNSTSLLSTPTLAAHTDTVVNVAHRFLPYYVTCGNPASNITGMVMYGQPQIPYILKEDSIGSVYNNIYSEIPVREMKWVRSEVNGKAAMQHGVYLYFNIAGGMIERYYDMNLDDVGPTKDEGLPRVRQGEISCLLPYPGRWYAAVNAGLDGYSSILCNNGMGWHEIYRADTIGKMITNMYVQTIPGFDNADRLFISEGTGIVSMPIVINPTKQYDYEFFGYDEINLPYIESGWIDFGLKDVNKFFDKVSIFSDCTDTETPKGTEYKILVYYKVDNQKSWKMADGKAGAYPGQEIVLKRNSSLYGKRIKLRIAMQSNTSQTETPRLKAVVVKAILRVPVKRSFVATFLMEPMKDLQDRQLTDDAGDVYDRLFYWANSDTHATPLTMNTNDSITDDKQVFIDPASINTFQVMSQMEPGSGHKEYKHVGQITIYEA